MAGNTVSLMAITTSGRGGRQPEVQTGFNYRCSKFSIFTHPKLCSHCGTNFSSFKKKVKCPFCGAFYKKEK